MVFSHGNRYYRVVPPRRDCVVFSIRMNLVTFRKYSRCYNLYFEQKQQKVKKSNNISRQLQMYPNLNVLHLINQKWNTRTKCKLFSECRLTRMSFFLARNILCYKPEITWDFSPKGDELTHINSPLVNATIWSFLMYVWKSFDQNHKKNLWSNSESSINGRGEC